MNNMQKNFKIKSALHAYADGGLVEKAKTDLSGRAAVIDNAVNAPPIAPIAPPAAKPVAPQNEDAARAAVGMAPKKNMLRTMLGLKHGGKVSGPGGPTEDKVPAMLSDGEYVLPADTVRHVGKDNLDALKDATHDPKVKSHGLRMAGGGMFDAEELLRRTGVPQGPSSPIGGDTAAPRSAPVGGGTPPPRFVPPTSAPVASAPATYERFGGAEYRNGAPAAAAPAAAAGEAAKTGLRGGLGKAADFMKSPVSNIAAPVARGAAGLVASAAPYVAAAGGIGGAIKSFEDLGNGERDRFNESLGFTQNPANLMDVMKGDVLRVLGNVGNSATGGMAGKVGQGLSSAFNGGTFADGFKEDRTISGAPGTAAPASPPVGDGSPAGPPVSLASRGTDNPQSSAFNPGLARAQPPADMNSPFARSGEVVNLGNFGGNANIYGQATNTRTGQPAPGGRVNSFSGQGPAPAPEDPLMTEIRSALRASQGGGANSGGGRGVSSNADAINSRYDRLAEQQQGWINESLRKNPTAGNIGGLLMAKYSRMNEQDRSSALNGDDAQSTARRGQEIQAETQANATRVNQQNNLMTQLSSLRNNQTTNAVSASNNAANNQRASAQFAAEQRNAGAKRIDESVSKLFPLPDGSGKYDLQKQQDFKRFLGSEDAADPQTGRKFIEMDPQTQENLTGQFQTMFDSRNKVRAAGASNTFFKPTTTERFLQPSSKTADMPFNSGEPQFFRDAAAGGGILKSADAKVSSWLPGGDDGRITYVGEGKDRRPVRNKDLFKNDDGSVNSDAYNLIKNGLRNVPGQ